MNQLENSFFFFNFCLKDFVEACLNKEPEARPTARDLLRHPFLKKARKNSYLMEAIDRFRQWKANSNEEASDSDSNASDNSSADSSDNDEDDEWVRTVKSKPVIVNGKSTHEDPVDTGTIRIKHQPTSGENSRKSQPVTAEKVPVVLPAPPKPIVNPISSACLTTVLALISNIQQLEKHEKRDPTEVVFFEELKASFEHAEAQQPGWMESFVGKILERVTPTAESADLLAAVNRVSRFR